MSRAGRIIELLEEVDMGAQCTCDDPLPMKYGQWDPPVYVCAKCGKNFMKRVESGEVVVGESKAKSLGLVEQGEGKTYIAVGPLCWGKASSREDAIKSCKGFWPSYIKFSPEKVSIYVTDDPNAWVDEYGMIHYRGSLEQIQKAGPVR